MEREAYQPPTASGAPRGAGNVKDKGVKMLYICGDCGQRVELFSSGHVACTNCAGRVLYKQRTKRMVQFEAR